MLDKQTVIDHYYNDKINIETSTRFADFTIYENSFDDASYVNHAVFKRLDEKILKDAEEVFKQKGKTPAAYAFDATQDKFFIAHDYKVSARDCWLYLDDVDTLLDRYKVFNSNISYEVVNKKTFKKFADIFNEGFKPSPDNPYSDWASEPFINYVKHLYKTDEGALSKSNFLVLKYKGKGIGSAIVSVGKGFCYVSSFTIPSGLRRTAAFRATYCIFQFIKTLGIKEIVICTEKDDYPYKIYTKAGFGELFESTLYKKQ